MTAERRHLVQASWDAVAAESVPLAERFYVHVFAMAPEARALFAATDMAAQRRKLTDMLAALERALDEPDRLVADAAALGARHAGYGVRDAHYAVVGDALRAALADVLGARFTAATHAAWTEAYGLLAALMRRGATHAGPTPP